MSYGTAIPRRADQNSDSRVDLFIEYSGDAGEKVLLERFVTDANDPGPLLSLRKTAKARVIALNANKALLDLALPLIGVPLDLNVPADPVVPSTYGMFSASVSFTPVANPQDVFTLRGSVGKTINVLRMGIMTTQTTAGVNTWSLVKRTTANSGGTAAAVAMVPQDSTFPAATGLVQNYTANPTLGNSAGNVWAGRVSSPTPATAPAGDIERVVMIDGRQPIATLRGVAESLCWNMGGAAATGLIVQASVWWTEN